MAASKKLMKNILVESLSDEHVQVIDKLSKPMYDEDIAGELKVKATIIRTLLNDLHSANLVEYERFKNKKTGWYTYLWNRREEKIQEYIKGYLEGKLEGLNDQLNGEKDGVVFSCGCKRVQFEEAADLSFTCDECEDAFTQSDNSEVIDQIVTEIAEVQSLLEQT